MKIYVSVGTHEQPFQRLLDEVHILTSDATNEWLVQYGVGSWTSNNSDVRAAPYLTPQEVSEALSWADIIVSQASPGNVFGALDEGVWPIVIGRQKAFLEHVDDHQVRFATALSEMGAATNLEDAHHLGDVLESESRRSVEERRESIRELNRAGRLRRSQFRAEAWTLILGE